MLIRRTSPFSSPLFCEFRPNSRLVALRSSRCTACMRDISFKSPLSSSLSHLFCEFRRNSLFVALRSSRCTAYLPFRVPFSASFAETPVSLLSVRRDVLLIRGTSPFSSPFFCEFRRNSRLVVLRSSRCTAYPRDISLFESPFLRVSPKLPFGCSLLVAMYCLYEGHLLQISPLVFAQSPFPRVSQKLSFRCSPLVAMYCLSEGHLPFRVPFSASFAETPVSLLISAGACEMRHGRCGVRRDSAQVLSLPSHFF